MSIPCSRSTFSLNTSEKNPRESTRRTGVISLMSAISVTATCMLASSPQRIQIRLHKPLEKEKDADGISVSNPAEIYPRPHDLANCHGCAPHQATAELPGRYAAGCHTAAHPTVGGCPRCPTAVEDRRRAGRLVIEDVGSGES